MSRKNMVETEKLLDIQRIVAQFERRPENTRRYIVGYIEGAASARTELPAKLVDRDSA